jgi:hypothetical protein
VLDKYNIICYYIDRKRETPHKEKEIKIMKFFVDCGIGYVFNTYEDAELFCLERLVHPENIYELTEEEAAEWEE